jgi:hypothetical protein
MLEQRESKRRSRAILRGAAGICLALILLLVSGFGIIKVLRGPEAALEIDGMAPGTYVSTGVAAVMDFYCEGYRGDKTLNLYAIVPEGDRYVTVIFPKRYFDSAGTIKENTYDLINGVISEVSQYVYVEGTVETLSEDALTKMYDWYSLNRSWMEEAGLVPVVEDVADVLSETAIRVDYIGHMNYVWVYILTTLALLSLLYGEIVLVRVALGKYTTQAPEKEESPQGMDQTVETAHGGDSAPENREAGAAGENLSAMTERLPVPDTETESVPTPDGLEKEAPTDDET